MVDHGIERFWTNSGKDSNEDAQEVEKVDKSWMWMKSVKTTEIRLDKKTKAVAEVFGK